MLHAIRRAQPLVFDANGAGSQTRQVTVIVNQDTKIEGDETFNVQLASLSPSIPGLTISNGTGQATIQNDDFDTTAPQITGVFVRGSSWTTNVLNHVDPTGWRGYPLPTGNAQLDVLPWANLNQIVMTFSEPVSVQQNDLVVKGIQTANYGYPAINGFEYAQVGSTYTASSAKRQA